jgi:hypothetical protein
MLSRKGIMKYIQGTKTVSEKEQFSYGEAKRIGDSLGIPWVEFGVDQFRMGLNIELEHGRRDPSTDVTHDEPIVTGKIALAHLNEIPDYYTRLAVMENKAERTKSTQRRGSLWEIHSTERNTLPIVLFTVIFAVMFVLEVWQVRRPSTSTTVGLRHGSPLR